MARIIVCAGSIGGRLGLPDADAPYVEVVDLSFGSDDPTYAMQCSRGQGAECVGIEPGDTWSNMEDAVQFAIVHVDIQHAETGGA